MEMMAIRTIPASSKETYCTLELLKCGALLLSVRCTERNVTTIDSVGILLFLITKIRGRGKKRALRLIATVGDRLVTTMLQSERKSTLLVTYHFVSVWAAGKQQTTEILPQLTE